MNEDIGIDKQIINKSEKIRVAWNDFFWEFRFCQEHIRFTAEEKSNYIGDLLNYFDDTLHHLEKFKVQPDYLSSLYETIAVLQMMYIQQDMIDELLGVVKLGKSNSDEKKFIRNLRNELIGHPISRNRDGKLVSSVFITGQTKGSRLSYIRYHKNNNYNHDLISHNWTDIYKKHEIYLNQFLDAIFCEIKKFLIYYSESILALKNGAGQVSFEELVRWVSSVFDSYVTNYSLFEPKNLLDFYAKRDSHIRYSYALGLFQEGLGDRIGEVIRDINVLIQKNDNEDFDPHIHFEVSFITEPYVNKKIFVGNKINYEFSKLYEHDHIFGIDYFKHIFQDDDEIMQELENMALVKGERTGEFYCSYEYLRHLFTLRGML